MHQSSPGLKVNGRGQDFFTHACVDDRDGSKARGIGGAPPADVANGPEPVLYGTMTLPQSDVARLAEDLMIVLNERKSPLLINDLAAGKQVRWLAQSARQLLAVPLQRQDQLLGCLFAVD